MNEGGELAVGDLIVQGDSFIGPLFSASQEGSVNVDGLVVQDSNIAVRAHFVVTALYMHLLTFAILYAEYPCSSRRGNWYR